MKIRAAVLSAALALAPAPLLAQQEEKPPPAPQLADVPRNLAEMLAVALRSNPEVLQAEAKVRQAQADLNQARLKVMEEVVTAFHEREKQQAAIRSTEQTFARIKEMVKVGKVNEAELFGAEQAYAESKAKLLQNEARARYILGLGGLGGDTGGMSAAAPAAPPVRKTPRARPPIPEKYLKALEKKVSRPIDLNTGAALAESLQEELGTLVINTLGNMNWNNHLKFEDQPLHVVLTAAADLCGVVLVFRDYGVLLSSRQRAATMNAPTFPEDVPLEN
jgi:hypothetical protein